MRSLSKARLGPVELITGGLLSTAAALAMVGPLIAALLIRRSGAGRTDPTAPLLLLTLALALAITAALTMFAIARRRRRSGQAGSS
ncbi:hypothetical protein ACFVJ5_13485 [Nocardia sp. NPDC127606]|uniref:hypothetical protein n=1 Tax=Nocardia sp. NPDC127606 TaxID=3345406 RepID=UPI003624C2E7